ncbi:hypothetical protein [Azospirillum palustre]
MARCCPAQGGPFRPASVRGRPSGLFEHDQFKERNRHRFFFN